MKIKKVQKIQTSKAITALMLIIMLTLGILRYTVFSAGEAADSGLHGLNIVNPGADDITPIPESKDLADGEVWTDKSVEYARDGIFDVTLRALGKRFAMELAEYNERLKPINAVFVLDTSSSMSYNSLKSKINAVVEAGKMILNANPEKNHVAVVYFDRTARLAGGSTYGYFTGDPDAATSASGNNRWTSTKTINKTWIWASAPEQLNEFIDYDGYNQLVPVTTAATNIVSGLNLAYAMFNDDAVFGTAPNKDEAIPIVIVMSDGAPNYYSTGGSYTNSTAGTSNPGANGDENSSAETIKRAAEISNSYVGINPDNKIQIYTVGYNVENNYLAWITLNPANSHDKLSDWQTKMHVDAELSGSNIIFTSGDRKVNIAGGGSNGISYYQYNTHYYAPLYPEDLLTAFREIVSDVTFDPASPLADGTDLVITEVIGDGFELIPESLSQNDSNVHYNSTTRTLTWTIPAGELYLIDPDGWGSEGENPEVIPDRINALSFKVRATGEAEIDKPEDGIYYTNNGAYADFTPHERNDNYSNKSRNRTHLPKRGWLQYEVPDITETETETETETTTDDTTETTELTGTTSIATTTSIRTTSAPYYPIYDPTVTSRDENIYDTTVTEPTVTLSPTEPTGPAAEIIIPAENVPNAPNVPNAEVDMIDIDIMEDIVPLEESPFLESDDIVITDNGSPAAEAQPDDEVYSDESENTENAENADDIDLPENPIPYESLDNPTPDEASEKNNPKTADNTIYIIILYIFISSAAGIGIGIIKNKKIEKI